MVLSDICFLSLSKVISITEVKCGESVWYNYWWLLKVKVVVLLGSVLRGLKVLFVIGALRWLVRTLGEI